MEDHYEINVAIAVFPTAPHQKVHYEHLFATAPRSCRTKRDYQRVLKQLVAKFPYPDYKVEATKWEGRGYKVDANGDRQVMGGRT